MANPKKKTEGPTEAETVVAEVTPVYTLTKGVGGGYVVAELLVPVAALPAAPVWSRGPEALDLALSMGMERMITTCGPLKKVK
ncbi:hypothetical protein [Sandaracinus amylolyticus]|uniref:hypothetical protein n=1 Tax=Sandaracinus amylolyticus TaxID=927083 RepID=UPI001F3C3156|nr:hypothetical protein [Sandaracinus amylolyticus]UJR78921.1 Hypothetical protein I5071_9540 [Sandaracinus amylolyticus]